MDIQYCSDYREMSKKAADVLLSAIAQKPNTWVGAATGNSPKLVYQIMADGFNNDPGLFKGLGIVKLDEWGGIPMNAVNSCETFIQQRILKPLQIPKNRYISFDSNPLSPESECERIENELQKIDSLDICILGLGKNGHIGFNEPEKFLKPYCHRAELSKESLTHQMVSSLEHKPGYGLTMGMGDILKAKMIILLITGNEKENVVKEWFNQEVTTRLPASFLWLHSNVKCYIDIDTVHL